MLVDVHTHLDFEKYFNDKEVSQIVERAKKAGVVAIVNNGVDPSSNRKTLVLSEKYDIIHPALGLQPSEITNMTWDEMIKELEFIMENKNKIVALGEVGLDYHWIKDKDKRKLQRELFEKIMTFSEKSKLPMLVHCWDAEKDAVEMILSSNSNPIMHCYSGPTQFAVKAIESGIPFSIPPSIKYKPHFQEIVKLLPINQILTETDAPWQGPERKGKNESANVAYTIKEIANLKNLDEKEVEEQIYNNFQRIFNIRKA